MSSSSKTENLELNNWNASDKPKREDFNRDNQIIDSVLGPHVDNDDIHVTASDKALWNHPFVTGQYFGTGAASRTINLGFRPSFAVVFANSKTLNEYNSTASKNYVYTGFILSQFNSLGVAPSDNGFVVTQSSTATYSNYYPYLNESGYTYCYIAFK